MRETGNEIKKPIHYGKIAGMKMGFHIEVRKEGGRFWRRGIRHIAHACDLRPEDGLSAIQ